MADPFEVRMGFSKQLQHLNASVNSAQKAAQYALKHKEQDEDLHSCILEQIEQNNMNTRANIMYFIEHFLDMACQEGNNEYVRMMQRDIIRVVDAVCPDDGSGAANVKVVRKVLQSLKKNKVLPAEIVVEIEECLNDRDMSTADVGLSSPANGDATGFTSAADPEATINGDMASDSRKDNVANSTGRPRNGTGTNAASRLDKRQIEQRIEEDRERHKRMRESMWQVPRSISEEARQMYEETSEMGEDDHILGEEEAEMLRTGGRYYAPETENGLE